MVQSSITPKQATTLRYQIQEVVRTTSRGTMDLCWACYEADTQMVRVGDKVDFVWKVWGYETWEEFAGCELGLHMTTAYAFRKVWEVFYIDLSGSWDEELLLPITKMRILSRVVTKDNVEGWLKKARTVNCRKLRALVYGEAEVRSFATTVSLADFDRIQRILERGKDFYDGCSKGEALANILKEWESTHRKTRLKAA